MRANFREVGHAGLLARLGCLMMGDDKQQRSPENLKDFNERLRHAQEAIREQDRKVAGKGTAYSLGFRIATDLVVAVIAGLGIGWGLDKLLGTGPVFLLIFMPFGIAAGILNVIRVAKSDEARRHMEQMSSTKAHSVKDDDDD